MGALTVIHGDQRVTVHPGEVAYIGRREDSLVVVRDPRVSRQHIRLSWDPRGWVLENVGRGGTFVLGQQVTRIYLTAPAEARLAVPDGPAVLFEPAAQPAPTPVPPAPAAPVPVPAPAAPAPAEPAALARGHLVASLGVLMPVRSWLHDPAMRQWQRLLVAAYALTPLILLISLQHTSSLVTLGWVYCLYIAPLWALVFWFLIRPGTVTVLHLVIGALIIGAEFALIPAVTLPWEGALAPGNDSHSLLAWIVGVGLPEELTKALPIMVASMLLLTIRHIKLDVRMWMFLATLSGLVFGTYEASQLYVPAALADIAHGSVVGVLLFVERVFVDGLQHAMWAGFAGFFIGLGTNYHRQRVPLWLYGILVPSVLHGMNDWIVSWSYPWAWWLWILIQAFSLFLFLGYTATAASIEQHVRHTPAFRGESMYLDLSSLRRPKDG